jgi:hypothetical protein
MLVGILEYLLPANFYSPTLAGLRTHGKVLDQLLHDKYPRLATHFQNCYVDVTSFYTGWVMRLFVDVFPMKTTLRIWDLLFCEGEKILFIAALAYLSIHEKELLELKSLGNIMHFMNRQSHKEYDYTAFVKKCKTIKIKSDVIKEYTRISEKQVDKETQELEQRRMQLKQKESKIDEWDEINE